MDSKALTTTTNSTSSAIPSLVQLLLRAKLLVDISSPSSSSSSSPSSSSSSSSSSSNNGENHKTKNSKNTQKNDDVPQYEQYNVFFKSKSRPGSSSPKNKGKKHQPPANNSANLEDGHQDHHQDLEDLEDLKDRGSPGTLLLHRRSMAIRRHDGAMLHLSWSLVRSIKLKWCSSERHRLATGRTRTLVVHSADGSRQTLQFGSRLEMRAFLARALAQGHLVPALSKSSSGLVKFVVPPLNPFLLLEKPVISPLAITQGKADEDEKEKKLSTLEEKMKQNKEEEEKGKEEEEEEERMKRMKLRKPSLISEGCAQLRRFLRLGSS